MATGVLASCAYTGSLHRVGSPHLTHSGCRVAWLQGCSPSTRRLVLYSTLLYSKAFLYTRQGRVRAGFGFTGRAGFGFTGRAGFGVGFTLA